MSVVRDYQKLLRFARSRGWRVKRVDFERVGGVPVLGRARADRDLIEIARTIDGKRLRGRQMLHTLLHEIGHMLAYSIALEDPGTLTQSLFWSKGHLYYKHGTHAYIHNERCAYYFGSVVASKLRIKLHRQSWRDFNWGSGAALI